MNMDIILYMDTDTDMNTRYRYILDTVHDTIYGYNTEYGYNIGYSVEYGYNTIYGYQIQVQYWIQIWDMGNQLVPYCLSINLVLENYKKGGGEGE